MTVQRLRVLVAAWCIAAVAGCADEQGDLEVVVSTDHAPGTDFVEVRVALFDELPTSGGRLHLEPIVAAARTEDDWASGVAVGSFGPIERRRWAVQAELLDAAGSPVGSHTVSTTLRGATGRVTIHVAREPGTGPDGGTTTPDGGPSDAGPSDASASDDGGDGPPADAAADAAAGVSCDPGVDEATLAFYDFEDDAGGTTLTDSVGGLHGSWNGGEVRTEAGPAACGQVLTMPTDGTAHGRIPHGGAWNIGEGSVDFWVRIDESPTELVGLVGRDERGTDSNGHLSVWLTRERIVMARLQNPDGEAVVCHEAIELGRWHHVGLSFGGGLDLRLWVDGLAADLTGEVTVMNPDESVLSCGGSTVRGLRGNTNPWVIGANTAFSNPGAAGPLRGYFRTGAIDRLRISDLRRDFTR